MIARGKNASDLFPAVVKNVACKNIEVGDEFHVTSLHLTTTVEKISSPQCSPNLFVKCLLCEKIKIQFLALLNQNGFAIFCSSFL